MISDSYENKALVLVLIRCVKLYFQCKRCLLGLIMNDIFFKRRVLDEDHTHHHPFPVFKKNATES